jgi:amino acid transporter
MILDIIFFVVHCLVTIAFIILIKKQRKSKIVFMKKSLRFGQFFYME